MSPSAAVSDANGHRPSIVTLTNWEVEAELLDSSVVSPSLRADWAAVHALQLPGEDSCAGIALWDSEVK
ncbi:hypothetical protein EYF80_011708 [Liparis tanakae]|uniref:Uncharacterized protein n=1 Tax=Liparis tanakae TaxID=230148 RepID=A0A4Z2IJA1_9TELE|nr:hypothetical protein EYF80_011708 [Liparis tanakae]